MTAAKLITMKTSETALRLLRQTARLTGEKQYRLLERVLRNEYGRAKGMEIIGAGPKNGSKK